MSSTASSAYVADVTTRYCSGYQRFIRHVHTPDAGAAITWDHPETLASHCDACKPIREAGQFEKLCSEAPMPGVPPQDVVHVHGVTDIG